MSLENWKGLLGAEVRPLSESESKAMVQLFVGEKGKPVPVDLVKQMRAGSMTFQIIESRSQAAGADVHPALVLFLSTLCENPAKAVMWAWTLAHIALESGGGEIGFDIWTAYFPMGVPKDEEYRRIWEDQKESGKPLGNNLDDAEFWPKVPQAV